LTSVLRRTVIAALAVMFAGGSAVTAAAQSAPSSQIPEKIEPPLSPPRENGNKGKFTREDGPLRPPGNIDPEMDTKPRDGSRMPVIPPREALAATRRSIRNKFWP
jgi:hypothetical protein